MSDKNRKNSTLWDFFITHFRFTFIVVAALFLFGVISILQLPKESDPEVDIPIAVIVTPFPGASPLDVEELVTNPIEDKLASISGIDDLQSSSRNGVSSITIEFDVSVDREEVMKDVDDAVDEAKSTLPAEAEDPVVQEISISDQPFLQLSLGGPFSIPQLTNFAEELKSAAERVSGVSNVQVIGGQDEEIHVFVNKAKLENFGVGIGAVTRAIDTANSDIPIGAIETAGEQFQMRLAGRLTSADDILRIPVAVVDGVPVTVQDVATVQSAHTEQTSISRLNANNNNPQPAVTLLVYKNSGGDITKISSEVKALMQEIIDNSFPENIELLVILDLADYISDDLSSLSKNGLATVVIVFVVLWIILGIREAIMAGIAIPLSFLMTFTYLYFIGYSINFMTLFALILSLGILVDSAIVVNEGMNTEMKKGIEPFQAASNVVREYQWPLIAGTLTTVFAFVPMLLTSGMIGEYIRSIPVTVSGVLISSLFVALAVVTTITAVFATYQHKKHGVALDAADDAPKRTQAIDDYVHKLQESYAYFVDRLLKTKALRKKVVIITILMMVASYALPAVGLLRVEMFPTSNEPQFTIDYEMPIGTPVEKTAALIEQIEAVLQEDDYITSYVVNVGSSSGAGSSGSLANGHLGYLTVNLVEENRPTSKQFVEQYQEKLDTIYPGTVRVGQGNFGPPSEAPVVVTVIGEDLNTLDNIVGEFETLLADIDGTENIQSSVEQTNGEFVIHVDRQAAQRVGLSTADIAFSLRNIINGVSATSINKDGEDVDIVVRTALNTGASQGEKVYKTDINTINGLTLATPAGDIPLSSVARVELENSRASIRHQDAKRIAKVTSFTKQRVSAATIFATVEERMDEITIPTGYDVKLGGENEDIQKSFSDMFKAMILAVFLIAALLVLQFDSFKQSLIILVTIPLALIGVFPGLAILNLPLSFPGIIGIVALVGIVVNNAIILIDKINVNKRSMEYIDDAIVTAGKARLKPIIMTTITTVLGIMPLAITEEVWRSLGFAIVFGLIFSTFLTLLIIPMLYKRWIKA